MDFIRPGIVDWKRVKTLDKMSKMAAKRLQEVLGNCNYAVELGKKFPDREFLDVIGDALLKLVDRHGGMAVSLC